ASASTELAHKGVLLATGSQLVKVEFYQVAGIVADTIYIPAETLYWYPHSIDSITISTVPMPNGKDSYVGVMTFN
ncbi:unnamed protein product, partial [marine sediment metagenome]